MLDKLGVIHLALAASNAGPGALARAKGIPKKPGNTRICSKDICALARIGKVRQRMLNHIYFKPIPLGSFQPAINNQNGYYRRMCDE
ncbi:hypothetical protein MNBD_ALPHA04-541 [hydrothermal vent metagenome]|uniref:Uncharacterized protein n=1 Tax=hydrothermal vent metagenome TaxID=652676 RepID=A0A3B0SS96_9ZZZZ